MVEPAVQIVCFSRDRPLQLHGYLASLFDMWSDTRLRVAVLLHADPPFAEAYADLQRLFPMVDWCPETDFPVDVSSLVHDGIEFTMFGCDDVVFVRPVSATTIALAFERLPDLLCLSLRLGLNVTRGMWGQPVSYPPFESAPVWTYVSWSIDRAADDWAYPWELDGTVYRTTFARRMLMHLMDARNPNQLEARGAERWRQHATETHMAAWRQARCVVPTVNVVQNEFPNGIVGPVPLEPHFLLDCWNAGLRMDIEGMRQMPYQSWRVPDFLLRRAS